MLGLEAEKPLKGNGNENQWYKFKALCDCLFKIGN